MIAGDNDSDNQDDDRDRDDDTYLLGTDPVELNRLGFQHQVWAFECQRHWRRAAFAPGQRLIDVGCGPGYASLELATLVGAEGRLLALDKSRRFVTHLEREAARRSLSQLVPKCVDFDDAVGLAAASSADGARFDGAYARWILCFFADPAPLLTALAAALRPGARLAIFDYYAYESLALAPRGPAFDRVIAATVASWRDGGGDLSIGNRLPALLVASGFDIESMHVVSDIARPGDMKWLWPKSFFVPFAERLLADGRIDRAERDKFLDEWRRLESDPAGYLTTPPMLEITAIRR